MRVNMRVYPAERWTKVGGRYGTADPPVLIVRVTAPAVDGRANDAVIVAVVDAFAVKPREIELVTGGSNRNKIVEVPGADAATLAALLER